ncbi:efflux RND transporter periplasmic adaptor subunit [Pararhodonellum marinum]|uniref:efflux RND transporter periplasmic adaptor subunit n=1 Tax=Pararhodonellum marinum TaxID=2755358 RepID=UPI0018907D2A|nr:efflux RND transporter periplasmic adaptor subunit [Pararhodonellum marinum]
MLLNWVFRQRLLSTFLALIIFSCGSSQEKTFPTRETITESVYASGIIKSRGQYQVFANTSGLIAEVFVMEGDTVSPGSPLMAILNEPARVSRERSQLSAAFSLLQANKEKLRELEINVELAEAKMRNDSLLYERQKRLREQEIGSQLELEQRELNFKTSKTNLEAAKIRYGETLRELRFNEANAKKTLELDQSLESDNIVKSKIKGVVYALLKEKGEMVSTQNPIATLGSGSDFFMELQVDEFDITQIKQGQKVYISMDSFKGLGFEGIVSRINPIMDEGSRSFLVEAVFEKSPPILYPNLTLEANILLASRDSTLTLPRSYLWKENLVILASGDTVQVETGLKNYQKIEILQGLKEDDQVVKPGA